MEFQTNISGGDVTISGLQGILPELKDKLEGEHFEIENADFTVFWRVELETRDWGVKGISWFITDVKGRFDVDIFDGNGDVSETKRVEFDFEPFMDGCDMEIDAPLIGDSISIDDLEIDYESKTIHAT